MTVAQTDIVCYEGLPSEHPLSHQTLVDHGYEKFETPSFYRPVSHFPPLAIVCTISDRIR
jgi:hypothetical protein